MGEPDDRDIDHRLSDRARQELWELKMFVITLVSIMVLTVPLMILDFLGLRRPWMDHIVFWGALLILFQYIYRLAHRIFFVGFLVYSTVTLTHLILTQGWDVTHVGFPLVSLLLFGFFYQLWQELGQKKDLREGREARVIKLWMPFPPRGGR